MAVVAKLLVSVISKQEIMVGSMFQAEIPAGTCKYKENEKGETWRYYHLSLCLRLFPSGER